tara:strand:- start:77 stop:268 length:192 start_codon:yes stop_codon:yes gene_type:complete
MPKQIHIVIENDEPQGSILFAITDLSLYLRDFNEDFGTDYSTMEEFNEDQIDRTMYEIKTQLT